MVRNPLNQKVIREIKSNWKQYLAVILIATLAVTLFTGIYANWQNFQFKLDTIYEKSNMSDATIMVDSTNEELKEEIRTYLDSEGTKYQERVYIPAKSEDINVNTIIFSPNDIYNKPAYMSIETLDGYSVLVDENFLERKEIEVGDTFSIEINQVEIMNITLNDVQLHFTISGTMTHPEALDDSTYSSSLIYIGEDALVDSIYHYIETSDQYSPFLPFITKDLIKKQIPSLYNQFLFKSDKTDEIISYVKENYEVLYALKTKDLPSNMTIEADVIQAKQLIYIFPVIFYLVAVLIILTSISQLINKEQKNIGLLKALGYSNREILSHYMNIFIVLCLIGSILGIILGPLIIPGVMNQKYNILYQLPKIKTPFFRWEYLYSVLILIIVSIVNSLFACYSSLKKVPAESIRGENSFKMKPTLFDRIPFLENKALAFRMALRNMKRKVSRTLMVLLGVMGCSALLLCGFGIEDTLNHSINKEVELIPFDISLTYSNQTSKIEEIEKINAVERVEEYAKYEINISYNRLISSYIYIIPENSEILVPDYDENSCLISSKVAEEIGAKVGDVVTFTYDNKKYDIQVTEIVDFSFSQGIFISQARKIIDYNPSNAWIRTTSANSNNQVAKECENIDGVLTAMSMQDTLEQANNVLSSIRIMTNTIKIFAILLALVVLYNLALLNFKERIKDIATLKVLGFSKNEIASSFLIEILFLTLVGSIIGLFLGYPLMYAVLSINENPLLSYLYHINLSSYLWTILVTAGSSLIINIIISRFSDRVQMVESLKAVE